MDAVTKLRESREARDGRVDTPLRVFIGYDPHETVAYHVLAHSILAHASLPVTIAPLISRTLRSYHRPRSATQATDFSFTRFLVPYLSDYQGVSIFMDCDMLIQADLAELGQYTRSGHAVYVCPHDYTPRETVKFLGNEQKAYPRKNWSSFMVFRNAQCRTLTPEYVNTASAADLHRLAWVPEDQIGHLPLEWNWLVGEYVPKPDAKNLHWTIGGPWFPAYAQTDHADLWRAARAAALGQAAA